MKKTNVQKLIAILIIGLLMMGGLESCDKDKNDDTPQGGKDPKETTEKFISSNKTIQDLYKSDKVHIFDAAIIVSSEDVTDMICDTTNSHYSLTFNNNNVPNITAGSVVMITNNINPIVVLVYYSERQNNTIDFYGPLGDLSYIFHDTRLVFTTNNADTNSDAYVFMPINNNITKKGLSSDDIHDQINEGFYIDKENLPIPTIEIGDNKIDINVSKLYYDHQLIINFTSSFSEIENIEREYWIETFIKKNIIQRNKQEYYKQLAFDCAKTKDYENIHTIDATYSLQLNFEAAKADALSEKDKKEQLVIYSTPQIRTTFPVIGLVSLGVDFLFEPEINISLDLSYTLSQRIHGTYYQRTSYIKQPNGEYEERKREPRNNIKVDDPNIPDNNDNEHQTEQTFGSNTIIKMNFNFPIIGHATWVDKRALGVGIGVIPYIKKELGYYAGISNNYGNIQSLFGTIGIGVDLKAGLYRTKIFSDEVQFPISIADWEFGLKWDIYHFNLISFPHRLKTTIYNTITGTKTSNATTIPIKFEVGKTLLIKSDVMSQLLGGIVEDKKIIGDWIYFRDKNGIIGEPSLSKTKEISWTPESKNDYLIVTIFGENGTIISSQTIIYDDSNNTNPEEPSPNNPTEPEDPNNPPAEEEKITLLISVSDNTEKIPTGKTLTYDYGQNVTFTAAVSPSNHVITIYDGQTKTDLKNGFNINTLSIGKHPINVWVDYDSKTGKGKVSSVVYIDIKEKQEEQPTPQITSVTITGESNPISNGDTKDFDYGDEVQIAVETDIDCDEISVDFPGYSPKSNNGEKSYQTPWFDATESGKVTITATKNGKSSTFYFNIEVEEKAQTSAPKITSVKVNESPITDGKKIKSLNWGDNVEIEVTTDIDCDEISIDYPNIFNDVKRGENRSTYSTSFNAEKYGKVTIVATKNGKTDKFEFSIMVFETVDAGGLPNDGAQKEAHKYSWCNDLVFQSAEKANFEGSYWVSYNGEDEYNRLVVSKKESGKFTSKQIRLIVSTSITDLSNSNIIKEQLFQGGENNYYVDITPTSKQLYLIVYVGGDDCGSVDIDGYYCGPFYYHDAQ